jgi:dienelactone hydrolase
MRRLSFLGVLVLILMANRAGPGTRLRASEPSGDDEAERNLLVKDTEKISERFMDGANSLEEWQRRQPRMKREYLEMLGLWPVPEKTPLESEITGTVDRGDVQIDLVHFQSRPGLYVTGNLYRPTKPDKQRLPAILYVCGHSGKGRDGNKTAFQDHGMWFASNGYVCLIIDTLQLGEIAGIHHGTYREGRWWWQAAGYTPAGVECWNGIRAIDYLVSRKDVDNAKIGVTGISGGGASTIWIAAADERVKCAVPVSGMSDLESYVTDKVINSHCDCMLMVNTYRWEWTTIAAMIAPRPLLFCNSDNDKIFPMPANRRIIQRLRKAYKIYDKPELVDEYVSEGGHDYRKDLRIAIFRWINKHLKNDTGEVKDADFEPLHGRQLRVFPTNDDIPKDAINNKVDQTFVRLASVPLPEEGHFDEWKEKLMKRLREQSFRTFPERIPAAVKQEKDTLKGPGWTTTELKTEGDVTVDLYGEGKAQSKDGVLLVVEDLPPGHGLPVVESTFGGKGEVRVLRLDAARHGTVKRKDPPNYLPRAHALVGRSVDEGSVWDIAATVRYLSEKEKDVTSWKVVGKGEAGILAAYAALFEPSITSVVVIDPPPSHDQGPIFLNVLRVLDVPDALGMLAPLPLTLINADKKTSDKVGAIYEAAGAKEKLKRKQAG